MSHPILAATLSIAVLAGASVPYFGIRLGSSSTALPAGSSSAQAGATIAQAFGQGAMSPAQLVVHAPGVPPEQVNAGVDRLEQLLQSDAAFGPPSLENSNGSVSVLSVPTTSAPDSDLAIQAIQRLRQSYIPAAFGGTGAVVLVGGQTAWLMDHGGLINTYTPFVFAIVLGVSFVVLLLVFRSVVVPVKAILMNLLSVGAAFGMIVLVFQMGLGSELLGLQKTERIEPWVPAFLFAILFGLSMDYHIFLLTRIRERFNLTADNGEAVAFGVGKTAGTITGAALIMVAVFASFATGKLVVIQEIGFGLAVAVFVDATIVRTVLVPATMALLGRWNWYLPRWMNWIPKLAAE